MNSLVPRRLTPATLTAVVGVFACLAFALPAHAAPGDDLRQITTANPSACGVNTGLAFDGSNLIWTCSTNLSLDFVSPADGSLVKTVTVTGVSGGLGAAAYDATRKKLWACLNSTQVVLIDPSTGAAVPQFSTPGCFDGLAFDGSDDSIWTSPDAQPSVSHWKADGTPISTNNVNDGGKNLLGGGGNSGIGVGGPKLYMANNGNSQIYLVSKDFSSSTLFATFPRRLEDMECDNVTFPGKNVIWSQDAYDRELNAYEIENGSCGFGGKAAGANVSGTVYDDVNSSGARDDGEGGIGGATVLADLNRNGQIDDGEPQTTTAADGTYSLNNLRVGDADVIETPPSDYGCTAPADCRQPVTLTSGGNSSGVDFGNVRRPVAPATSPSQGEKAPCSDSRYFRFELHHGPATRVVKVRVWINHKLVKTARGKDLRTFTLRRLPKTGTFDVKIVSTHSNGSKIVSLRRYKDCTQSKPNVRSFHHRRHHHHHH